jgi:calmodulin
VAGNGLIDESEFLQWVGRIQALSQDASTDDADDITKDLIAAFRVFDRDGNGYITKVSYLQSCRHRQYDPPKYW